MLPVLIAVLAVLVAAFLFFKPKPGKPIEQVVENVPGAAVAGPGHARGAGNEADRQAPRDRRAAPAEVAGRRLPVPARSDDEENDSGDEGNDADGGNGEPEDDIDLSLLSKKEVAKIMKKRERAAERAAREAAIEEKKKRNAEREEAARQKANDKEAVRLAEEARVEEERAKKSQEEFDEWKNMFSVDAEGEDATAEDENALEQFVEYIQKKKVVVLEELASEFGLRTQDAVDRVTKLAESKRITGVIDDRGKFIYITPAEMAKVANFIRRRGRVTLAGLAAESNKLIDLTEVSQCTCVPFNLNHMDVLKQYVDPEFIHLAVSYGIIAGSAVVKVPQIINLVRAGTARGLNLPSIYLETVATLAGTIYNLLIGNPFRTYGETALILLQNLVIVVLCWSLSPVKISGGQKSTATSVFVAIAAALWNVEALKPNWPAPLKDLGITPLDMVYNFMTLLFIVARVPQILQNWKQGHTGVLSGITLFMNIGGNGARIATSVREGLAPVVVYSFVLNLCLNIVLFAQVLVYWKATNAALAKGSAAAGVATPRKAQQASTPASKKKSSSAKKPKAE